MGFNSHKIVVTVAKTDDFMGIFSKSWSNLYLKIREHLRELYRVHAFQIKREANQAPFTGNIFLPRKENWQNPKISLMISYQTDP